MHTSTVLLFDVVMESNDASIRASSRIPQIILKSK